MKIDSWVGEEVQISIALVQAVLPKQTDDLQLGLTRWMVLMEKITTCGI